MQKQFPTWLRRPWPTGAEVARTRETISDLKLHTVCESARCPNLGECWAKGTATVMLLGNTCTRNCSFCSVPSGQPGPVDPNEARNLAEAVHRMNLKHTVVTTVVRDDLPDGGSSRIAEAIRAIHDYNPQTTVEILVSDFALDINAIWQVIDALPEVFSHNIETVRRLHPAIRDRRFSYTSALATLRAVREYRPSQIIKSALMVGHGETTNEVRETLADLRDAGCEVVCIGQYLRPSKRQREVAEFVHPDRFERYKDLAYDLGFEFVVSGPFVRSSYRSEEVLQTDFGKRKIAEMSRETASRRSIA